MMLEKPGLYFKVHNSSPLGRILIESNIKYVIPKPVETVVLTDQLFPEASIEMHYVDDVFQISLSYEWISMIHKKHGDYYFEPICDRIENLYRERYAKKPDYAVDFIIVKLREWLSMGFKQFMENDFYPIGLKTPKTMEQAIQEYVINGLISDKYFNNLVTSKVSPPVRRQLESLSHQLPGVYEYVKPICCCIAVCSWAKIGDGKVQLWTYIQHLNDAKTHVYYVDKEAGECEVREAYTREEIADWLETLDIDIRFKTPERIRNEQD